MFFNFGPQGKTKQQKTNCVNIMEKIKLTDLVNKNKKLMTIALACLALAAMPSEIFSYICAEGVEYACITGGAVKSESTAQCGPGSNNPCPTLTEYYSTTLSGWRCQPAVWTFGYETCDDTVSANTAYNVNKVYGGCEPGTWRCYTLSTQANVYGGEISCRTAAPSYGPACTL